MRLHFMWIAFVLMVSTSAAVAAQDSSLPSGGAKAPVQQAPIPLPPPPPGIIFANGGSPDDANGNEMTQWLQTEDFALASDGCVSDVHFVLGEAFGGEWEGTLEYFFFADSAGVPGALIASGDAQSIDASSYGAANVFGDLIYVSFLTESPVCLSAGTTYWLGLHANGDDYVTRDEVYWVIGTTGFGSTGVESFGGTQDNWFNNGSHHWFVLTSGIVYSPASPGIANGSFEFPDEESCGFITKPPGTITDWTIGGVSVDHICQYWTAADGDQSLDMSGSGPGSVTQTLTGLDDGHPYRVTFMMSGNSDGGEAIKNLTVGFNGTSSSYEFNVLTDCGGPCDVPGPMGWTEKVFEFTAPAASIDLAFTSTEAGPYGAALDDVKLFFGNRAPVADDDTFDAVENTPEVVSAPGLLSNDSDPDGDPLTVFAGGTSPSNGTLDPFGDDGSFTYTPAAGFCGTDSFTYYVEDNYGAQSAEAAVTINVACRPDITSVDPNAQTVDYSDAIGTVTIIAEDDDSGDLTLSTAAPLPAFLTITGGCSPRGAAPEDGVDCEWYLDSVAPDHVNVPAQIFQIDFVATDPEGNTNTCSDEPDSDCSHELTVEAEDAKVTLDENNPIDLNDGEGEADSFYLKFKAVELQPDKAVPGGDYPGDLNNMDPGMDLVPVGPGGPVTGDCDWDPDKDLPNPNDGYGQVAYFTCHFTSVEVNTYEVVAKVDNGYYVGSDEGVLVVYDPSLGFTTGGGFFYWPGTVVPPCDDGPDAVCDVCAGWPGDKTNFGFTFKYNKKQKNVQGSLLMMRHTCDGSNWKVKSNATDGLSIGSEEDADGAYGWAAVSGKATFRDPTEENSGGNQFFLYVEDHGDQGCSQDPADEFWIEVLADNVWDDPLGPDPADEDPAVDGDDVPIFCGNIVVPHETGGKGGGKPPR